MDHASVRSSLMMMKYKLVMIVVAVLATGFLTINSQVSVQAQVSSLYLRMILVQNQEDAKKVANELAKGKSFADVASQFSVDSTKERGGFLGQVALKDLNEQIQVMVRSLKVGGYTGPVQVENGLAFFQRTTTSHYTYALELMRLEKFEQALEPLSKDLALNPDRTHSLALKAYALQRLNQAKVAENVYRQIIKRDPKNVLAHNNLGTLLDQKGDHPGAAKHFERAVEIDSEQDVTLHNLAWIHSARLNNPAKALGFIRKATKLKPNKANYHAMLADIFQKLGERTEAQRSIARAIEIDSKNESYRKLLGQLSQASNRNLTPPPKKKVVQINPKKTRANNTFPKSPGEIPTKPKKSIKTAVPEKKPLRQPPLMEKATKPKRHRVALSRPTKQFNPPQHIKIVTRRGGARKTQRVAHLLKKNGFPIALRLRETKTLKGIRIYYKNKSVRAAGKIRDLITPRPTLRRLTWKSQFDIIVFVGN